MPKKSDSEKRGYNKELDTQPTPGGLQGTREFAEENMRRFGMRYGGGKGPRYATGREDGAVPEFPGIKSKLQ